MKVLSLFSGVGGFDLGLEAAGMETVALCEWDKKAASVLRRHWPHVPIYGDVSDLTGTQLLADGVHPDLVAFGSPCQDLSVAGKRAGLAGERSGLFHEAVRIIRELRDLTAGALPRWVIWENVVGALNSNGGADFQAVLDEMGNLGAVFSEWAVLDAQNFGVAQRRRRVFLVSCLDPGAARGCPDPLLPVREGGPRDLVPLRAAWKNAAGSAPSGARGRSFLIDGTRVGDIRLYEEPVQTLKARMGTGGNTVPLVMREPVGFSHTQGLDAQPSEDHFPTLRREGGGHAVAQPFTKAKRAQSTEDNETWVDGEVAPTLNLMDNTGDTRATVLIPYREGSFGQYVENEVGTLKASGGVLGGGSETFLVTAEESIGPVSQPIAFSVKDYGADVGEVAPTIRAGNSHHSHQGGGNPPAIVQPGLAVRRLLPIECERLMGWPDDWTRWDADGKEQADSHRYKQCGNGVASPVAAWVGRHIFAQDAIGRSLK